MKTEVNGRLQKSVLNLIEPPIPPAHNVPRYCNTGPVLVKRNSLGRGEMEKKKNRRHSNRYVNEAIVPAGSLGILHAVLRALSAILGEKNPPTIS